MVWYGMVWCGVRGALRVVYGVWCGVVVVWCADCGVWWCVLWGVWCVVWGGRRAVVWYAVVLCVVWRVRHV